MKSFVLYGLVAAVLFAVSSTISLYYLPGKPATTEPPKTSSAPKAGDTQSKPKETEPEEKLRPLVKSGAPDAEQAALLLQTLREREKAVREKEDLLGQRRKQMELIYQDIRSERAVLDDLRKQVSEELKELGKKVSEMEKRGTDLDREKQKVSKEMTAMQQRQIDMEANERKNIDKLAKVYESMAPENAARIMQQMADSGKMDTAVKMLSLMRERQAAAILDQISDASLAGQFTEKLRGVKRSTTPMGTTAPVSVPTPKGPTPG